MTTIKKGCRGDLVATLQRKLNLIPDGIFGAITDEAVRDFQKSHALTVDGIVGPKTWAALGVGSLPNTRRIDKIIIHCSATPEGKDFTVDQIRQWHLDRGFSDVGYHYVIYRDGSVHRGRPETQVGAHTTGYNSYSIGICYIGGCAAKKNANGDYPPKDTRTPAQRAALVRLVAEMRRSIQVPQSTDTTSSQTGRAHRSTYRKSRSYAVDNFHHRSCYPYRLQEPKAGCQRQIA